MPGNRFIASLADISSICYVVFFGTCKNTLNHLAGLTRQLEVLPVLWIKGTESIACSDSQRCQALRASGNVIRMLEIRGSYDSGSTVRAASIMNSTKPLNAKHRPAFFSGQRTKLRYRYHQRPELYSRNP